MIRPMRRDDAAAIHRLREGTTPSLSGDEARATFERLLPTVIGDGPSGEAETIGYVDEENGRITGMIVVLRRDFEFEGSPLVAAVSTELFVEASSKSKLGGVLLLRALLEGNQDLTIADLARDATRPIWARLGGSIAPALARNWLRPVAPAAAAAALLADSGRWRALGRLAAGPARVADALLALARVRPWPRPAEPLAVEALTPELFAAHARQVMPEALRPCYHLRAARWLFTRLDYLWPAAGVPHRVLLRDHRGAVLGWFIYQLERGGLARVAHLAAVPGGEERTVDALLGHAAARGAGVLLGREQPRFVQPLADRGSLFVPRSSYALVHARDPRLLSALCHGDAFLTLTEGEGVVQLVHRPLAALHAIESAAAAHRAAVGAPQ